MKNIIGVGGERFLPRGPTILTMALPVGNSYLQTVVWLIKTYLADVRLVALEQ